MRFQVWSKSRKRIVDLTNVSSTLMNGMSAGITVIFRMRLGSIVSVCFTVVVEYSRDLPSQLMDKHSHLLAHRHERLVGRHLDLKTELEECADELIRYDDDLGVMIPSIVRMSGLDLLVCFQEPFKH